MGGASTPSGPTPGYRSGQQVWYVNPQGLAADPQSSANWSTTPRAGWVEATPTGRMYQAQYDPNNQYIPEFQLPDGRTFKGLDRGPGDGSRTMQRIYGTGATAQPATPQAAATDTQTQAEAQAAARAQNQTANRAQGRAATSTTGAGGLLGTATVRRRNLLGV